ncbi:hypothetical protein H4J51_03855 [Colwellia sp. MB02u-18]|uniref:hypothetical protein n=1 Tax=unclassified Colwellia TaxID=196834 RepID=UPI0015F37D1F|nr:MULTISPECIES: hypothetical protein [unclassified Colwellia]MBA6224331.1 hypothetical protein [Colwellia sp. MB3u-45]MBA6268166.1 hypothetical protein [Colwellia sp. MB3u-43]MBA6321517.1 hypothetical protein [Colwellia sp. MB02u-19]MBA6323715.1 hypothetical protein [Colwellia sp. MB02u-18]MBA6331250.1 hypothetical protein [Colwellia sp. MB02u-12]
MDIMTETLPISIQVSDDLVAEIKNIAAISNKLEAQLNFHTMTANWYGDEADILQINFYLVAINEFGNVAKQAPNVEVETFADDVLLLSSNNKLIDCHVAITAAESELIRQQPKLLSGYLAKKLSKILNLIADRQQLTQI